MAIIHQAQLTPSKAEMLEVFLRSRPWGEGGEIEILGAYRFDDPAGEVGVECHLARVGENLYHLPLTYRDAPLEGAEDALVGTMEHSVLGTRYVYDGLADEVALDCFARALCAEQSQAELAIVDEGGAEIARRPQSVRLDLVIDEGATAPEFTRLLDGEPFTIARTVEGLDGTVRLVASWPGGRGVIAAYDPAIG
ncbi:CG0192-related protein [Brachybacterium hainanense]|uniref:Maltokinase N-terminal cap domain-containing protein n=1 Tax=Brachybacterium hainanense TaxID=1541174 RepID=A0ABV6RCP7_9MICO